MERKNGIMPKLTDKPFFALKVGETFKFKNEDTAIFVKTGTKSYKYHSSGDYLWAIPVSTFVNSYEPDEVIEILEGTNCV